VRGTGYTLNSPVSPSLPPPAVRHRVPSHFIWVLPNDAHENCFKRILKFTLKQLQHVSV